MFGDLMEVVFALLRQLDIGILMRSLSLLCNNLLTSRCLFLYVLFLLLQPRWRLRIFEVKLMLVISGLDFMVE